MNITLLDNIQSSNITISLSSLNIRSVDSISRTVTIDKQSSSFIGAIINSKLSISQSLPDKVTILS